MKRTILIAGSVVLVVLLAGVAWLSIQSFTGPSEAAADAPQGKSVKVLELVRDEGNGPMTLRITVEPADELPNRHVDAGGVFVGREGDVISVGTGSIELDVNVEIIKDQEPDRTVNLSHSGPVVEVVISGATTIYRDVTDLDLQPSKDLQGEITIQQVVEAIDSQDGIGENTELQVWGQQQDGRIVAEVLVFHNVE